MENNWFAINRSLTDSDMWLESTFTRGQAWVDLIALANFKTKTVRVRGIDVVVKRGQVGFSVKQLAERWRWSRGRVTRFLWELQKYGHQIVHEKNNVGTIITIMNYDKYQPSEHQNGQQNDTRMTPDGHQNDTPNKDKEGENDKEEEKKTSRSANAYPDDFEKWWKSYPKQGWVRKPGSLKKWKRLSKEDKEACMNGTAEWIKTHQDQIAKGMVYGAPRFLEDRIWEDVKQPIYNQRVNILEKKEPPRMIYSGKKFNEKGEVVGEPNPDWEEWKRMQNIARGIPEDEGI